MPTLARTSLDPRHVWIAVAPAAIFAISAALIAYYAEPFDAPPEFAGSYDPYKAGTARIAVLAAFMLFLGACFAALSYFVYRWRLLNAPSRWWTLGAYLALGLGAISIQALIGGHTAIDYAGRSLACFAAQESAAPPARKEGAAAGASARQAPALPKVIPVRATCEDKRFARMVFLGLLQNIGIVLAFSALVCGAISALADRPGLTDRRAQPAQPGESRTESAGVAEPAPAPDPAAPADDPDLRHWEEQSEALNAFLYLGALLLATALLFLNAYLRWPAFVLAPLPSHNLYIETLISYYGFTFSVMLGAFYVPAALILSRKVRRQKAGVSDQSKLPAAFQGPLQALKIVLAISSSAIAGALPDILDKIV